MEAIGMSSLMAILILIMAVLVDYFYLDMDKRRWGWLKKRSKRSKALILTGILLVSFFIYLGLSSDYFM